MLNTLPPEEKFDEEMEEGKMEDVSTAQVRHEMQSFRGLGGRRRLSVVGTHSAHAWVCSYVPGWRWRV